ncbi:MAG: phosphotransferase family protein [Actinomycetales bacterium]
MSVTAASRAARQQWAAAEAARRLGVRAEVVPSSGASGETWLADEVVLRVAAPSRIDRELAAMRAAAGQVPVPAVSARCDVTAPGGDEVMSVIVMPRLQGRSVADMVLGDDGDLSTAEAATLGRRCLELHAALARVDVPADVPRLDQLLGPASSAPPRSERAPSSLLHLDLHPGNILVDEALEVLAVIDWANAAAGPPVADLARTESILTLDPVIPTVRGRRAAAALLDAWAAPLADRVSRGWRLWSAEVLRQDLAERYAPEDLRHVDVLIAQLRQPEG